MPYSPVHVPLVRPSHEVIQAHIKIIRQEKHSTNLGLTDSIFITLISAQFNTADLCHFPLFEATLFPQFFDAFRKICHKTSKGLDM